MNEKKVQQLVQAYENEQMIRGGWSSHEYAQDYLKDLYEEVVEELKKVQLDVYDADYSEDYYRLCRITDNRTDFSALTALVWDSDMSFGTKTEVANTIQEQFEHCLEDAIDMMRHLYCKQTGTELAFDEYEECR
jgi:hypothetical protein